MQQDQPKDSQTESLKKEIETKNEEIIKVGPPLSCIKGGHYLVVDGMEMGMRRIRCDRCPVGFYITGDDELRDGHVYTKGKLLI
jgi:hypothetical protein